MNKTEISTNLTVCNVAGKLIDSLKEASNKMTENVFKSSYKERLVSMLVSEKIQESEARSLLDDNTMNNIYKYYSEQFDIEHNVVDPEALPTQITDIIDETIDTFYNNNKNKAGLTRQDFIVVINQALEGYIIQNSLEAKKTEYINSKVETYYTKYISSGNNGNPNDTNLINIATEIAEEYANTCANSSITQTESNYRLGCMNYIKYHDKVKNLSSENQLRIVSLASETSDITKNSWTLYNEIKNGNNPPKQETVEYTGEIENQIKQCITDYAKNAKDIGVNLDDITLEEYKQSFKENCIKLIEQKVSYTASLPSIDNNTKLNEDEAIKLADQYAIYYGAYAAKQDINGSEQMQYSESRFRSLCSIYVTNNLKNVEKTFNYSDKYLAAISDNGSSIDKGWEAYSGSSNITEKYKNLIDTEIDKALADLFKDLNIDDPNSGTGENQGTSNDPDWAKIKAKIQVIADEYVNKDLIPNNKAVSKKEFGAELERRIKSAGLDKEIETLKNETVKKEAVAYITRSGEFAEG